MLLSSMSSRNDTLKASEYSELDWTRTVLKNLEDIVGTFC
jgi:hypothetical protein